MKRPALWRYLWRLALGALAVAWLALMVASYYAGLHEANGAGGDQRRGGACSSAGDSLFAD